MADDFPDLPLRPGNYAFFFDLDGTLAKIIAQPEQVSIPAHIVEALHNLSEISEGAVALISGRSIKELDRLSYPLHLACAGVHGAERRDIQGRQSRIELPPAIHGALCERLSSAVNFLTGVRLEDKGNAFALHYRANPEQQSAVHILAQSCVNDYPMLTLQPGKCVVELKPAGVSKGAAIEHFLTETPFLGRTPLFIGDDITDEAGFEVVNRHQGISIKVGGGNTQACLRLADVPAVWRWLLLFTGQGKSSLTSQQRSRS